MPINFNTANLVIFQYPTGAGGKFIMSCVGLNSGMVLENKDLALRQLENKINQIQKYQFLQSKLTEAVKSNRWNDLGQGCDNLFGIKLDDYDKMVDAEIDQRFNTIIQHLSQGHLKFPIVAHTPYVCKLGVRKWSNAKIVQLINNETFYQRMRPNMSHFDEQQPLNLPNHTFEWDHSNFFNKEKFLLQMQSLYSWLNLSDFNAELISNFHNRYIEVLETLLKRGQLINYFKPVT